jgi:hypothetical protein
MHWLWRRFGRNPAFFSGAVLVTVNVVAISGLWRPGENVLAGINTTLAGILALLVSGVPSLQAWRAKQRYLEEAKEKPLDLVETASNVSGEIVGRDELCHVLIENLENPDTRNPHVVVGGVGTGRTALVVRLTQLLAQQGKVPVPVRLRDAQNALDFRELARQRFLAVAGVGLLSDVDGERIWRQLHEDDQIIVLADGLEEVLIEGERERERDYLIRLAIDQANQQRLPLIITSRPHDPLRMLEAAIIELEPLSEEAALEYIQRGGTREDEHRLDWLVETADVAETPLYLQITRQLHQVGLIQYVSTSRDGEQRETDNAGRAELRLRLLDTWMQALVRGHFLPGVPLSREDRMATVEQLSALACIGLKEDRFYVSFDDTEFWRFGQQDSGIEEVARRLKRLGRRLDLRLAAIWGMQLGLVDLRGEGVRFRHGIMQAYLGSRLIDRAMADPAYRNVALEDPGRELLIALVMQSRANIRDAHLKGAKHVHPSTAGSSAEDRRLQDLLREAAWGRDDVRALDLYAAALEIDSVAKDPSHRAIAEQLQQHWPSIWARDFRTLESAKFNVLRRFGEAARTIAKQRGKDAGYPGESAYRQLYRINCSEPSYPIRLVASEEIGDGGDEAFDALEGLLGPYDALDRPEAQAAPGTGNSGNGKSAREPDVVPSDKEYDYEEQRRWREGLLRAWLAPRLVGSVTRRTENARTNLEQWLEFVGAQSHASPVHDLGLSLEIALAQGFKYAANRRRRHPQARPEARAYLAEQAREMLRGARFWFSRLTLVQALCLWSLPDNASDQRISRGDAADPRALIQHWVARPNGEPEHPFVLEAGRLAVSALETGQPERFVWIDETSVVAKVGSRPVSSGSRRQHNLWIPPSTGWTALHPRAQQLIADVLLLLNLAERGAWPSDRNRRLQRTNQHDLPPCLAGDRSLLDPTRTVGMVVTSEPGSNCKAGCTFELCPYPPKGEQPYRGELSEAFCRRQQALANASVVRRRAPWRGAPARDIEQFWKQMGRRAQLWTTEN